MTGPPLRLESVLDLSLERCDALFARADALRAGARPADLRGRTVALLFFESSTRTRLGFAGAAGRLSCTPAELSEARSAAGMSGPESLEDTLRSVCGWFDAVVVRHSDAAAMARAAALVSCPFVSAGAGRVEHPTQALVDAFALRTRHGSLAGLRVGVVGDLAWSRAAHSLALHLDRCGAEPLRVAHPDGAGLPAWVAERLARAPRRVEGPGELGDVDAVYVAGLPAATARATHSDDVRRRHRLDDAALARLRPDVTVLCPLPRIDEIDPQVDRLPQARYFDASRDALHVRIALLEMLLGPR